MYTCDVMPLELYVGEVGIRCSTQETRNDQKCSGCAFYLNLPKSFRLSGDLSGRQAVSELILFQIRKLGTHPCLDLSRSGFAVCVISCSPVVICMGFIIVEKANNWISYERV